MLTIDTAGIAELLGVSRQHVTDRVVTRPDFPKPVVDMSQRVRRWAQDEVLDYIRAGRRSSPPSPGSRRSAAATGHGAR